VKILRRKPKVNELKAGSRLYAEIEDRFAVAIVLEANREYDHFRLFVFNYDKEGKITNEWTRVWKTNEIRRMLNQVTYFTK
jgi:hypothetical protein